jgi:hypothetical protein
LGDHVNRHELSRPERWRAIAFLRGAGAYGRDALPGLGQPLPAPTNELKLSFSSFETRFPVAFDDFGASAGLGRGKTRYHDLPWGLWDRVGFLDLSIKPAWIEPNYGTTPVPHDDRSRGEGKWYFVDASGALVDSKDYRRSTDPVR